MFEFWKLLFEDLPGYGVRVADPNGGAVGLCNGDQALDLKSNGMSALHMVQEDMAVGEFEVQKVCRLSTAGPGIGEAIYEEQIPPFQDGEYLTHLG